MRSFPATLMYTAFGRPFMMRGVQMPAFPEDKAQVVDFMINKAPDLVKKKLIKPMRVRLGEGGLEGINDGLNYLEAGKVSGEKLVYRIDSS
jgi:hypothetical protein